MLDALDTQLNWRDKRYLNIALGAGYRMNEIENSLMAGGDDSSSLEQRTPNPTADVLATLSGDSYPLSKRGDCQIVQAFSPDTLRVHTSIPARHIVVVGEPSEELREGRPSLSPGPGQHQGTVVKSDHTRYKKDLERDIHNTNT